MPTYRIQSRRDTYANWQNSTQVLLEGEIAINTTDELGNVIKFEASTSNNVAVLIQKQCLKIGDGINTWSNLNFAFAPSENPPNGQNNYAPVNNPNLTGLIALGVQGGTTDTLLANTTLLAQKGFTAFDNCTIGSSTASKNLTVHGTITADNLGGDVAPFLLPTGTVLPYAGATAPTGFLLCDGAVVSRTGVNASLFAVIGTTYGAGDGSTTFALPDLRGRVPAGSDQMNSGSGGLDANGAASNLTSIGAALGSTGGSETHTLTTEQMPAHNHTFSGRNTTSQSLTGSPFDINNSSGGHAEFDTRNTSTSGGGQAHPIVQPTIILNYMIKL